MIAKQARPAALVLVDADNTLWDTDAIYRDAQLWLLTRVEEAIGRAAPPVDRLALVREADQALARSHHSGLRYPIRLLAKALALILSGEALDQGIRRAWAETHAGLPQATAEQIEATFLGLLAARPALREGVEEGLSLLNEVGLLPVVLTEGRHAKIQGLVEAHGLAGRVDRVLEAPKTAELYRRLKSAVGKTRAAFMIGDQYDRDIEPAIQEGFTAIYCPGGFRPNWIGLRDQGVPRVRTFLEAATFIIARISEEQSADPVTVVSTKKASGPGRIEKGRTRA